MQKQEVPSVQVQDLGAERRCQRALPDQQPNQTGIDYLRASIEVDESGQAPACASLSVDKFKSQK